MLSVVRPPEPPAFLLSPIVRQEKQRLFSYLRRSDEERLQRRDGLADDLFYNSDLRAALHDLFNGRCAFCETELHNEGIVHHFRPLRFAEDDDGTAMKDHYLWLAFEWRNLFIICGT